MYHHMPSQSYRYAVAANKLLANTQEPIYQPPHTMLLSTFDANQENIKEWAILDSGANCHFLCLDAPITTKQTATYPITVLQSDRDKMVSTHTGDLDLT